MKQENKIKEKGERIAKFLARSGVASRRESEKLISYGRIKLNGKILSTPAVKVTQKMLYSLIINQWHPNNH